MNIFGVTLEARESLNKLSLFDRIWIFLFGCNKNSV